ncbi:sulfite exporter TauE/SafE family protein [Methanoplanus endosymbiosus]|uniref:Probable membrane transporter protein n=1 Tax=Methanoplanus endosymbiosus TaxID=33865 RepID=A0A9E7PMP9_9EURY|nr:sulfite exporter TauE/SafE family protein [Methanoplanus endosymbiosus]UUX93068.1 sulfite exporter TauE/SafE family protein [Methanoplanus endosymbiosus]
MDFILPLAVLVIAGLLAGLAAGMLGVGGSFITVPALYWVFVNFYGIDETIAIRAAFATGLAVVVPTALSGVYGHNKSHNIEWKSAVTAGITGFFGGLAGAYAATVLDGEILRFLFAGLLAVTAIRLFLDQRKKEGGIPVYDPFVLLAGGFITGIASGMFGIGGGVILVPFLIVIVGFPTKKAVGTSSAYILFSAAGGIIMYLFRGIGAGVYLPFPSAGYISLLHFAVLAMATVTMANAGVFLNRKFNEKVIRVIFIILLIFSALEMIRA